MLNTSSCTAPTCNQQTGKVYLEHLQQTSSSVYLNLVQSTMFGWNISDQQRGNTYLEHLQSRDSSAYLKYLQSENCNAYTEHLQSIDQCLPGAPVINRQKFLPKHSQLAHSTLYISNSCNRAMYIQDSCVNLKRL